jgi:hypothetical protein
MPVKPSKKLAIVQRRQQVADLYLQGWTQMAIADRLQVGQATVSTDLKAIQDDWRSSTVRDLDLIREVELRKLPRLERECWAAWERSQKPSQSADIKGDGVGAATRKLDKNQYVRRFTVFRNSNKKMIDARLPMASTWSILGFAPALLRCVGRPKLTSSPSLQSRGFLSKPG